MERQGPRPLRVRILQLDENGAVLHPGLYIVEAGSRLIFSVKSNARISLVSHMA